MARRTQVLVIGSNGDSCTGAQSEHAYGAGAAVARAGAVLVTGGLGGVMEAASRGASEEGGLVVGVIPYEDASRANGFCDVVIPTGIGMARDYVNAHCADGVVVVGGGSGTLSEACAAYMHNKPMVVVRGLGGSVEQYIDGYIDGRRRVRVLGAGSGSEAAGVLLGVLSQVGIRGVRGAEL